MPKLPTYDSKASLSTQTPEAIRSGAEKPYEAVGQALNVAQDVVVKWQGAINNMQDTFVKAKISETQTQILTEATNDTDINGEEGKIKAIQAANTEVLKSVTDAGLRSKLAFELEHEANLSAIKIRGIYAQKKLLADNLNTESLLDMYAQQGKVSDMKNLVDNKIKLGFYSVEKGAELLNKKYKDMGQYDIYNDPATKEDESVVLAELKKGDKGKYASIPGPVRLDLIQESQRRIFQNNQTFKRDVEISQGARNDAFIDKLASGTATFKDIEAEKAIPEANGGMKREVLLKYQLGLQKGVAKTLDDMMRETQPKSGGGTEKTKRATMVKQYNDLIDSFVDDTTDQWRAKDILAQAYVDGIINPKEQQFLNNLKKNSKDIEFNRSTSPVVNAIKGIKDMMKWQQNSTDEELAFKIKQLVGGVMAGGEPAVVQKQVMTDEVAKNFPDYPSYEKEGRKKLDKVSGRSYVVYPDKTWAWIATKKTETKQ